MGKNTSSFIASKGIKAPLIKCSLIILYHEREQLQGSFIVCLNVSYSCKQRLKKPFKEETSFHQECATQV